MAGLTFKLDDVTIPKQVLGHDDVPVELVGAAVSYEGEQKLKGIGFSFNAEARAKVEAFNAPSDQDKDGIIGPPDKDEMLSPPLTLTKERAWLKYRVETKAKVSAEAKLALGALPLDLKVDSQFGVVFTDFHVHDRAERTDAAVLQDLTRLRFAGNPDDILKLGPHEALSYQARGELTASVTLRWSDVFTSNLNALASLLKGGAALALEVGGSVSFDVGLIDVFRVVFLKGDAGGARVAIKKLDTFDLGFGLGFGVTARFADPGAVKKALNDFIKAVTGEEIATIDAVIGKASLNDLTDTQRALVVALFERLGVKAEDQPWNALQAKWAELKGKVEQTIKQVAEAKVKAGFEYEYLRLRREETLLEVELDEPRLREFHNDLMLCEIRRLLAWAEAHPAAVKRYLRQKELTREHAWGFTLGIGPWLKIGGLDGKKMSSVVVEDRKNNRQRVAYHGVRHYPTVGGKDKWTSDFKAQMPKYSSGPEATACEFEYGLHFHFEWERKKLSEDELELYADHAVIWRALNASHLAQVKERLRGHLGQRAQVSVQIKIGDEALRRMLPRAAAATDDDGARALARAMPYWSLFEARKNPLLRELCYAPLWKAYFQQDDADVNNYALTASKYIGKLTDIPEHHPLAAREKGLSSSSPAYQDINTFAGQIYYNGLDSNRSYSAIHDRWQSFCAGLRRLNAALTPSACAPRREIEQVFESLTRFWSQSLFVRAAGVFLLDMAAQTGVLGQVERTLTIHPGESDEAIIFSASIGK